MKGNKHTLNEQADLHYNINTCRNPNYSHDKHGH